MRTRETYENPVLNGDYPDPAVIRVEDTYYLTVSTGKQYPGLTIYASKNLVDWQICCHPLKGFAGDVWAPDLVRHDGRFYLYFTASGSNWVIHSDKIDGGWSAAIDLRVGHIDPGHCVDDAGNRWLFLSGGRLVALSPDGLSTAGAVQSVFAPLPIPDAWDVEGFFPESPKVFRHGGYYYMLYANGGTGGPATSHMVACARARAPQGPWEHAPRYPMLRTASRAQKWHSMGHGHLVEDMQGGWWLLYHAYERGYRAHGRKLLLSPVRWGEDGWPEMAADPSGEGILPAPPGERVEETPRSDAFDGTGGHHFKAWGDTELTRYRLEDGMLALPGLGGHIGESMPLTVAEGAHRYQIETCVQVQGGCAAGLITFYDPEHCNALGLCDGVLTVYRVGRPLADLRVDTDRVWMRMVNDDNYITFYYSLDGQTYTKINNVIDTTSQEAGAYGGFGALRPGLFAAKGGMARFAYYNHTEL